MNIDAKAPEKEHTQTMGATSTTSVAMDRLRQAFWHELAEHDYERITVRDIVRTAGLNKNTFYYHYANMEDLAKDCIEDDFPMEIPTIVISKFLGLPVPDAPELRTEEVSEKMSRLALAAGKHSSPALQHFLKDSLFHLLTTILQIDEREFGTDASLAADFLIGGIIGIIGRYGSTPPEHRVPLPDTMFFAKVSAVLPRVLLSTLAHDGVTLPEHLARQIDDDAASKVKTAARTTTQAV